MSPLNHCNYREFQAPKFLFISALFAFSVVWRFSCCWYSRWESLILGHKYKPLRRNDYCTHGPTAFDIILWCSLCHRWRVMSPFISIVVQLWSLNLLLASPLAPWMVTSSWQFALIWYRYLGVVSVKETVKSVFEFVNDVFILIGFWS